MLQRHAEGVVIAVWLVPAASRTEVAGVHDDALRLRVTAPPEKGAANAAAAKLLSGVFGVGRVELLAGASSRAKRFLVGGLTVGEAQHALEDQGITVP